MMQIKKTRWLFSFMIVVFLFPVLAGTLLYFFHDKFNFKTTQHGVLVQPVIEASYLVTTEKAMQKKWYIVQIAEETCDKQCEEVHHKLLQIEKVLDKNKDRVEVVLLSKEIDPIIHLSHTFDERERNFIVTHKIYLIDPLGNLLMYYPDTVDPMNILKDMKKLLEVSQIG